MRIIEGIFIAIAAFFGVYESLEEVDTVYECEKIVYNENSFSEELKLKINELNNVFSNDSLNFAYYYEDINTGFSLGYNEDSRIFGASVMKAPTSIYIYEKASEGLINLDEKLVYTSNFFNSGSGIIKKAQVGTEYTIRELVHYAIKHSDNIAFKMLVNRFGLANIREFWREKGTTTVYENGNIFSSITARDGGLCMKELYDFYNKNKEYGGELLEYFKSATVKHINPYGNVVANKSGGASYVRHDMAIVFDDKPYIFIVLTKRYTTSYYAFFNKVSLLANEINSLYNSEKREYCINENKK